MRSSRNVLGRSPVTPCGFPAFTALRSAWAEDVVDRGTCPGRCFALCAKARNRLPPSTTKSSSRTHPRPFPVALMGTAFFLPRNPCISQGQRKGRGGPIPCTQTVLALRAAGLRQGIGPPPKYGQTSGVRCLDDIHLGAVPHNYAHNAHAASVQ